MKKKLLYLLPLMLFFMLLAPFTTSEVWAKDGKQQIAISFNEASWSDSSGNHRVLPELKLTDKNGKIIETLNSTQGTSEVTNPAD